MSFSKEVKDELNNIIPKSRHCLIAELAGIITTFSKTGNEKLEDILGELVTDANINRKVFTLLKKTLNIKNDVNSFNESDFFELEKTLKLMDDKRLVNELIIQQPCCKRAFIRGSFIVNGSISDPNKGYHMEVVLSSISQAFQLMSCINFFDEEAKMVERAGKYIVYLKEGGQIVELLRIMEASHSVLELENIRVVKEVRENINRKVNCETANISKTVNAAVRQIEDIRFIDSKVGLDTLPEQLQDIAKVRLDYPDTPLGDLGQFLDPPIGKSGVNHRLKKLAAIADSLR
ncbi:MAG: DNA-binding protein WhiA [Pseudobutyrivibrio sp.]|nr:DNA-binding protein WhiA [Pseudobutyrivibrio sp.]